MDHETGRGSTVASYGIRIPLDMIVPYAESDPLCYIAGFTLRPDVAAWLGEAEIPHWLDIQPTYSIDRCELTLDQDCSIMLYFWKKESAALFRLFWGV